MINTKNLIIGFDPGLINTGWGVLEKIENSEKYVDHGCISTSKKDQLGKRLNLIYDETLNLLRKYTPDSIAVEKIFANKNPESTMKLGKARAIIFLVAAKENIDIFEYSPNTVKKNLVGYGHASKSQIVKMVERIFPNLIIEDENSADALAVAICHSMQKRSKIFLE
ncbi:MAG: crossover junction endodeoxyribonuclease RuvC [Pseudomonadota bacterium]|nr:crossover junction endodeoxyribonuclease RuvC [Pseudomonadota bacterium]